MMKEMMKEKPLESGKKKTLKLKMASVSCKFHPVMLTPSPGNWWTLYSLRPSFLLPFCPNQKRAKSQPWISVELNTCWAVLKNVMEKPGI